MYLAIVRRISLLRPVVFPSLQSTIPVVSTSPDWNTRTGDCPTRFSIRTGTTLANISALSVRPLMSLPLLNFSQKRFKKRSMKKSDRNRQQEENQEDSDDDDDDEMELGDDDARLATSTTASMRMDAVGKITLGISRAKFDENFYNGLIRLNGERIGKKSHELFSDDQIDLIRGFNAEQREMIDINRVHILTIDDKASNSGRIKFVYRKTNKMTIENYPRDPYDGSLVST